MSALSVLTVIPNCIPLVQYLANKTQDPDEAFSAGICGLEEAIRLYNPHKGANFVTFAYTIIQQRINAALFPVKHRFARQIKNIQDLFYLRTGKRLSPEKLSALIQEDEIEFHPRNLSIHDLLIRAPSNTASLEQFLLPSGEEKQFADESEPLPEHNLNKSFVAEAMQKILCYLTDEEQKIIKSYFGIGTASLTQEEIAALFGVTYQAIQYQVAKILEKLSSNRKLEELYTEA